MSAVELKVKEIICEQLGLREGEVSEDANLLEDLGADSLDIVELIMAMEEEFELEIPDEDAEQLLTVKDTIKYVTEKTQ